MNRTLNKNLEKESHAIKKHKQNGKPSRKSRET